MEFNKKRKRLEEAEKEKKTNQDNNEDVNSMDESFELDENGIKRLNLPKKSKYRMRAHCNPLAGVSIAYPVTPKLIDWSIHFPLKFGKSQKENAITPNNTWKYPIKYPYDGSVESTHEMPIDIAKKHIVNIVDIGCGYGGLLYNMSPHLSEDDFALGMEIRDKVSVFVSDKIKTLRVNSCHKEFNNISMIRTNTMKLLLNYFYKGQLDKMFFCFADPHFKRYNHRKRIINKYLLNDYGYVLKIGGKLYTITDVEELHKWHLEMLENCPLFKRILDEEVEKDILLECMKNTDEAKKVKVKNGNMYWAVYERVAPQINTIDELLNSLTNIE